MNTNNLEDILYRIMSVLNDSNLPIIFKGALVLFKAKSNKTMIRGTKDIDCDWIDTPPSNLELEQKLNDAIKEKMPEISFVKYRDYDIGKCSAGFEILLNNQPLTTMDMSIRPETSSKLYYVGEYNFRGYDLNNIVSDKISVLSSRKIARRIKDLMDVYSICLGDDLSKIEIMNQLKEKNRQLEDFSFFFNNKDDVEHAYNKYKTVENKPDFNEVYSLVKLFIEGILDNNINLTWNHNYLGWLNDNKV